MRCFLRCLVILLGVSAAVQAQSPMAEMVIPGKYTLHYPVADHFCTPTRTTYEDAARTSILHRGRRVQQLPNGGFGKPLLEVQGQKMYHTGADIGWFRLNEPVFAVANGIVRISHGSMHAWLAENGKSLPKGARNSPWDWGNLVVIEHRLPDGSLVTTLYAHLDNDRLVQAGDIVSAGQQIGVIGAKSPKINGGYEPHLHFGVRKGRLCQPGNIVFGMPVGGKLAPVKIVEPGEYEMTVVLPENAPRVFGVTLAGKPMKMTHVEGSQYTMSPEYLWKSLPLNMPLAGYQPNLEDWIDPVAFLRQETVGKTASPLYFTMDNNADMKTHSVGRLAPSWQEIRWLNRDQPLDPADLKGKVVCVFCFQSACHLSGTTGWPAFRKLLAKYANDEKVQMIALQTAFTNPRRNNEAFADRLTETEKLTIPVGHLASSPERPAFLDDYGIRATPWIILIDSRGLVQTSTFMYDDAALTAEIDRLKSEPE